MFVKYEDPDVIRDVFKSVDTQDIANLKFYLTDGADIDMRHPDTNMPLLHYAVTEHKNDAFRFLLDAGADSTVKAGPSNYNALHFAVYKDNGDAALLLLQPGRGHDIHDTATNNQTALHMAAWHANKPMAELLLQAGANPALTDSGNHTPYDIAFDRAESMFDFAKREYQDVGFLIRRAAETIARTAETEILARDKVASDLAALQNRQPHRFRLKP